ncbi:hypothetical protein EDD11_009351, partial [Mortierella claussenii]
MVKDIVTTGTLDAPYEGSFKVVRRTTHGIYVLRDTMNRLARNYAPEQLKLAFRIAIRPKLIAPMRSKNPRTSYNQ